MLLAASSKRPPGPATKSRARPPHRLYTLLEWRALLEFGSLPLSWPALQTSPAGDGHPVLLLPGFAVGDSTLGPLALFLRSRGYAVETWGLGRNRGFQRKFTVALEQKLRHIHHRTGRKVSLVGWSLGGVFAYDLAHRAPECVRTVISLGSPMQLSPLNVEAPLSVKVLYRWLAHPLGPIAHLALARAKMLKVPPPVPSTCIYSDTDGVVPPHAAILPGDFPTHENLRVPGSHIGLGVNPMVLWLLADRLAQAEGSWTRFVASGTFGKLYRRLLALPKLA